MSINPVTTAGSAGEPTAAPAVVGDAPSTPSRSASVRPDSGTKPREEIHPSKPAFDTSEMPQDEVQVQRTNGASGDIVIKYLDASGNLILQIPSAQVLGLARAVERALEEQANRKIGADQDGLLSEGGSSDGH